MDYYSIVDRKRRVTKSLPMDFLRSFSYSFNYAIKTLMGPRPHYKKEVLLERKNKNKAYGITNRQLQDHFDNESTYYYCSCPNVTTNAALMMIDIDCHRRGTQSGAHSFAVLLKSIFPTLYYERSTNGKGIHAYVVLWKKYKSSNEVKRAFNHFQKYLQTLVSNFDIEHVEIKGHPPVCRYEKGVLVDIHYGQWAKIPRESHRYEEWDSTTQLSMDDIYALKVHPGPRRDDQREILGESLYNYHRETLKRNKGSTSSIILDDKDLGALSALENTFKNTPKLPTSIGPMKIDPMDYAQAVILLQSLSSDALMNKDGTIPNNRIKVCWDNLYKEGLFTRAYHPRRFKVIRDWFDSQGWILWESRCADTVKHIARKWKFLKKS